MAKLIPHAQTAEQILNAYTQQVREWRLDALLYQLLEGQQKAKYQLSWYLQYQITPEETQQFLEAFAALEKADPNNPYISWVKMIQHLYGLGVTPSLEYSRFYLQEYEHRYSGLNAEDSFTQSINEANQLPKFLRCQWFASLGNGDAVCDLAQYYLTETQNSQDVQRAINLLTAAANFGHLRALDLLVILFKQGKHIPPNLDKAQHYARRAFLRKVAMYPDEQWQIKDLPGTGYSERLAERNISRTYHETLCMLQPEYDFLFAKGSSLVPLVHQPSVRGVLENLKVEPNYFINHLINYDKKELRHVRLQIALQRLIKYHQLPKIQRDQVHLLLAYEFSLEKKPRESAEHALTIKQPYIYVEVIRILDPNGEMGQFLLSCVNTPEVFAQIQDLNESETLLDYALIYLIACLTTLDSSTQELLQKHLLAKFSIEEDLQKLSELHIEYCQLRYALYKIHHRIYLRSWWRAYLPGQQRTQSGAAQTAWETLLQQLYQKHAMDDSALAVIQRAYPLLTNNLDQLRQASPLALAQTSDVGKQLLFSLQRVDALL